VERKIGDAGALHKVILPENSLPNAGAGPITAAAGQNNHRRRIERSLEAGADNVQRGLVLPIETADDAAGSSAPSVFPFRKPRRSQAHVCERRRSLRF